MIPKSTGPRRRAIYGITRVDHEWWALLIWALDKGYIDAYCAAVRTAVGRARDLAPDGVKVEVECDTPDQVRAALAADADIIMLDNMAVEMTSDCVKLVNGRAFVEASGGVNTSTVRAIAETGVDWISIGALTHSAPAMDLALDFE
jgi:nicotinate-nucleotide pyrophosphorylase (carboxylating)